MIKILDVEQGTEAWFAARIGIPTASSFEKILSPTGKASTQWETYAHLILAEEIMQEHEAGYQSADMLEGQRREAESVAHYEFTQDLDTTPVGFIHDVPRTMGCSPDRLVGDDGLLELKNPKSSTQVEYLLKGDREFLAQEYRPQLQGTLLITGRKWIDIMAYHPHALMPKQCFRIARDEPYLKILAAALIVFNGKLAEKRAKLIKLGHLKVAA